MKTTEIRKQISIFIPVSEWKVLREAAAQRDIPITELCRRWLRPGLDELKEEQLHRRHNTNS